MQLPTKLRNLFIRFDNYMEQKLGQELWDVIAISLYLICGIAAILFALWAAATFILWLNDYVAMALVIAAVAAYYLKK